MLKTITARAFPLLSLVRTASILVVSATFVLFTSKAFAEAEKPVEPAGLNLSTGLDVIGGLFLVLALFMACAWLMKRTQGGFLNASKEMKTLGAMSLGTREKAVLVEVEGKKLLLGVSPGRVNTLHVFNDESANKAENESEQVETSQSPQKQQNKTDFASQLMQLIPKNSTASK